MIYLLIGTGLLGAVMAQAYVNTGSLHAPIAIHLGWNITNQLVFSGGPLGDFIFVPLPNQVSQQLSAVGVIIVVTPIIITPLANYMLLKRRLNSSPTSPNAAAGPT